MSSGMSSFCFKLARCSSMRSLSISWAYAFMVCAMLLTSVSAPLSTSPILIGAHTHDTQQKTKNGQKTACKEQANNCLSTNKGSLVVGQGRCRCLRDLNSHIRLTALCPVFGDGVECDVRCGKSACT